VIGSIYEVRAVPISFKEQIIAYVIWFGASSVGGIIGGLIGFIMKRTPYALLTLLIGLIMQLIVNGKSSWRDIVGISQNVTYCLMIFSIIFYLVIVKRMKELKRNVESNLEL
jgi:predicted branched-subunit amino acid permease